MISKSKKGVFAISIILGAIMIAWVMSLPVPQPGWPNQESNAVQDIYDSARDYLANGGNPADFERSSKMNKYWINGRLVISKRPGSFVRTVDLKSGQLMLVLEGLNESSCVNLSSRTVQSFKNGAQGIVQIGGGDEWIGQQSVVQNFDRPQQKNLDDVMRIVDTCMVKPSPLTIKFFLK